MIRDTTTGVMEKGRASLFGVVAAVICCTSAWADCIAKIHSKHEHPIYEVVSCGPAEPIIELLRQSRPARFGKFSYAEADVVITVKAANDGARKLMWGEIEYWYHSSGCANVREGMRFVQPRLKELCCDTWPVSDLPCGVGTELLTVESRGAV